MLRYGNMVVRQAVRLKDRIAGPRNVIGRQKRPILYSAFDCFGLGFRATCFDGNLHGTFLLQHSGISIWEFPF
jgi:hypothetical protein